MYYVPIQISKFSNLRYLPNALLHKLYAQPENTFSRLQNYDLARFLGIPCFPGLLSIP